MHWQLQHLLVAMHRITTHHGMHCTFFRISGRVHMQKTRSQTVRLAVSVLITQVQEVQEGCLSHEECYERHKQQHESSEAQSNKLQSANCLRTSRFQNTASRMAAKLPRPLTSLNGC